MSELTFAEAIQLVEGSARDVEFRCKGGDWAILTKRTQLTVEQFANWEFRRARPKYPLTDALTFAEAMALDPSEVEMQCAEEHCWTSLTKLESLKLSIARDRKFRRARPKRSRVQEMAEAQTWVTTQLGRDIYERAMTDAIRAVCEWLRPRFDGVAYLVEREFLVPR